MHKHRLLAALAAAFAIALLTAPSALAAPVVDGEFAVDSVGTDNALVAGPDGNMWVTLDDATNNVARITPAGVVTPFDLPDVTFPVGITVGPDGNLWVTRINGVAKFSPDNPLGAQDFTVGGIGGARGITTGPDGNLWAASDANVVRIDPDAPETNSTAFPVLGSGRDIAAGGDGNIWVADAGGGQIVSVTTDGAQAPGSPYAVGEMPQGIAAGPGTQIAYANPGTEQTVGRITPGDAPLTTPTPMADPFGVALGADQAYWIAQFATDDLGRLTPDGQYTTLGGFSAGSGPRKIAAGPDNTLWVTLDTADKVGRVTGLEPPMPPPNGGGGEPDTLAPVITGLSMAKAFRVGKARTPIVAQRRRVPTGTTVRYSLSEAAAVRMRIERVLPGRRRKGKCVKPSRKLRKARKCKRFRHVRTLRREGSEGANAVPFSGRIGRRALKAGRYRLVMTATDAADNRSAPTRKGFRILRTAKQKRR